MSVEKGKSENRRKKKIAYYKCSKSPIYKPSSCKLSKMQMCPHMSSHVRHEWNCSLPFISYCWGLFNSCLPSSLPPPVSNSSCLYTDVCQLLYYNFSRYCSIRLKMFSLFLFVFMYYLCEKYYKHITLHYYIADYVSWVPKLTLLNLWTNWP